MWVKRWSPSARVHAQREDRACMRVVHGGRRVGTSRWLQLDSHCMHAPGWVQRPHVGRGVVYRNTVRHYGSRTTDTFKPRTHYQPQTPATLPQTANALPPQIPLSPRYRVALGQAPHTSLHQYFIRLQQGQETTARQDSHAHALHTSTYPTSRGSRRPVPIH